MNTVVIILSIAKKANAELSPTVFASFSGSFVEPPGSERKTFKIDDSVALKSRQHEIMNTTETTRKRYFHINYD